VAALECALIRLRVELLLSHMVCGTSIQPITHPFSAQFSARSFEFTPCFNLGHLRSSQLILICNINTKRVKKK
jgi:hypothetical protein